MLEEDAAKFDAFLKDNDAAVQDAQRRADAETAARQVKVRAPHSLSCMCKQVPTPSLVQTSRLSTLHQSLHFSDGGSERSAACGRSAS